MALCYCVPEDQVYVVETCGSADEHSIRTAGFFAIVPCVCEVVGEVSLRLKHLECGIETKTVDDVFVNITVDIQYRAKRDNGQLPSAKTIFDINYRLTDERMQIRAYVEDKVRAFVPLHKLDSIFTLKEDLVSHIKSGEMVERLADFGWTIEAVLVTEIDPVQKVKDAMNSINAQARIRTAVTDKAEAEKIQAVKLAEAEAEAKKLQGDGIARQRNAIIEGLQASTQDFASAQTDISHTEVMELVLITQYFDTLKNIGGRDNTRCSFVQQSSTGKENVSSMRQAVMEAQTVR